MVLARRGPIPLASDTLQPVLEKDATVRICFSSRNADPRTALRSYFDALKREVAPLSLWEPVEGTI